MALSDPPHNPTEAQELFKTSLTADVIHNREISFPPNVGYFPVPPHTFDRSPFDLELAYASSASVSGLMAALPQWNLDPASEAVDKKPWRVIWPYHPILNTWSKGSGNTPTVDKFKHIDDLDEATVAELPPGHEDYSQGALIFPLYRIIAYHTVQQVRYKFAQWVELQLSQRDLAPYFHDLKLPDRGPVPLIPPEVVTRIAQADHHAMLVMHGKRNAHNSFELKKYCNKQEIPFPLTTAAAPGPPPATKAHYPSLSETKSAKSATKPYSKPPPAALSAPVSLPKKPTNYAMSLTTQRPLPPPPKQTAPSSSTTLPPEQPETPVPEESADVHMADPHFTHLSFEAMLQARDVAMTPAQELYPDPMDISTSPTHFASLNTPVRHSTSTHLRPTIHPPTRPTPDAPLVPAEQRTPSLFQRFAEVFRPLPFIGNLFKLVPDSSSQLHETSVMSKGLDIFRWLFPSSSPGTDTTQALTHDMPLASMISACVDVEASFADPMKLSRPQICPEPPDVAPLPLPSPSDSSFAQLVHFLHEHVSDHLRRMQQIGTFTEVFATFIVGPPNHSNAGSSLHSHLVGCATTDPDTHHLVLYVPTGAGQPYTGPSEWAPVMVHIAASLLWPDLPFLVTSPDYILGAQASLSELRRCLGYPSAFSLFTTSHSLAGSDVLLHFPPPSTFSLIPVNTPPIPFADHLPPPHEFCYTSPEDALQLIATLTTSQMEAQHNKFGQVASNAIDADLYYPLFCTPYYGYQPTSHTDFLVMVYQLSAFIVHCCYTKEGALNPAIVPNEAINCTPADLMSVLSTTYKQWTSLHPGEGVLMCSLTEERVALRPFPISWLYHVDMAAPSPPFFGRLADVFSAGTEQYRSPIFDDPINLGPAASLHLNPALLDPPHLDQSNVLQIHTSLESLSWGAIQYHYTFYEGGPHYSLLSLTPDTHPPPDTYLQDLLDYEGWPSANTLFLIPNCTTSGDDTSTLSLWCPDQDTSPSPSHSITLCCGSAYSANASSHGPTFGYRDWQAKLPQGKGWRAGISHTPQYEPVSILFFRLLEYWTGFLKLDRAAFVDTVSAAFDSLHSHYSPGLPAWSLPPHSLAQNLFAFLFTIFYRPDRLIEGFGAGAYSAAVAAALSLAPPKPCPMGSPESLLISLGGLAMHPPTFTHLIMAFGAVHNAEITVLEEFLKPHPDKDSRPSTYVSKWNKDNRPEFKTALLLVQHVHDRVSPWTLSPLLLSYLYNLGIKVLTLHDNLEAQRDYALLHQKPLVPFSHFGSDRHDYERVVPTLKTFSASTFFSNFLEPLTYEQLEAREGSLGSTYCPDLLDLVIGLFTYLGTVPPLLFGAQPDALTQTLIHGCHRPPAVTTSPLFPSTMELHESPVHFYTKIFLHSLRLPSLRSLGLPADDILALEESLKQARLSLPLPQALDVLHTQVLSCMCVSSPRRETPNTGAPPIACYLSPVEGSSTTSIAPPVFRCWIGRKVSPNMAILDFKCDSLPWASSYIKGTEGRSQFGFSPGNLLQLVFPTREPFVTESPYFSFALFLTSVTAKGRVVAEIPDEQTDASGSQVTQFSGILLPFLLKCTTIDGTEINQMYLPLLSKKEQLQELVTFPPLDTRRSFYMPLSAPRGLLSQLLQVPFFRIPKTLGWPFLDSPMPPFQPPPISLQPLLDLLGVLPFLLPPRIRNLLPMECNEGTLPWKYSLDALSYLVHNGILPGTSSTSMDHTYEWPLDWTPRDFKGNDVIGMTNHLPEAYALITALGPTFIKRLTHALLARDGHFASLLLSTIWGLTAGHTSLCVQGIFGSGKTYNSSLLVIILSTVLGLPTLISSEPNLPLATAADTICDLLQDAPPATLQQYARCLAGSLTATTPIDYIAADRAQLFKDDSPLRCLILTQN